MVLLLLTLNKNFPFGPFFDAAQFQGTSNSTRSSLSNMADQSFDDGDFYSTSGPESDYQPEEDRQEDRRSVVVPTEEDLNVDDPIQRPMFLHLTCSCHFKSNLGNAIRPISVTTLPTCLGNHIFVLLTHFCIVNSFAQQIN